MRLPLVLFVAPSAYLLSGLASWLDSMEPGLTAKGWQVVIGLVEGPAFHRPEEYLRVHPHRCWIAIPCRTGTEEGRLKALVKAVRDVAPDLVVSVNIPDVFGAVARIRTKGLAVPKAVMTVHGIEPWLYEDMSRYRPWLDGVVCTNRLACRLAGELGHIGAGRIGYAHYGVADRDGKGEASIDRLRIAYVGRLEQWQKRVHDIPGVLDHLEASGVPFELVLAGDGPEEALLKGALAERCAAGQVRFLGRLQPEEVMREVYPHVDALLMPPFWETGPIVIWEAMSCGVPVVASRYVGSGCEGALRHEENALLFAVGDTREAAQQLARLWREPALAQRLSSSGHELVKRGYSLEASVAAWDSALSHILRLSPLPAAPAVPCSRPSGRLDLWLGAKLGETVRSMMRRKAVVGDPGGEWPHSYSTAPLDAPAFWTMAERIDRGETEIAG